MGYIGRAATNAGSVNYLDDISSGFDGSDTTFTCAVKGTTITPGQENVYIYLDGVFQHPSDAYSISGSTITFTEAPVNGTDFTAYVAGEGAYLDDGTVSTAKLDDDAVTASKLDDDGTGFQVGDLGVGGSLTSGDKLTVTGRLRASGGIIGDLTGNASGTAATVTGAAQSAITSVGTLTTLTVDNVIINGTTIGHTSDTDLLTFASSKLTVAGDVKVDGGNALLLREDDTYINSPSSDRIDFRTSGTVALYIDSSQDATFASWATITEGLIVNESGGDNDVRIESQNQANMFRIDASTDRIGIRESTPLATLHIKEGDSGLSSLNGSGTNLFLEANGANAAGMTLASGNTANGYIIFGDSDSNFRGAIQYDHSSPDKMHLVTAGSQRLSIDQNGKVGIATTSPDATLHVSGTSKFETNSAPAVLLAGTNATTDHTGENSALAIDFRNLSTTNGVAGGIVGMDKDGLELTKILLVTDNHDGNSGSIRFYTSTNANQRVEAVRIVSDGVLRSSYGMKWVKANGDNPAGDFQDIGLKFAVYRQTVTDSHRNDGYINFSCSIYRDNVVGIIPNHFGGASTNNNLAGFDSSYIASAHLYAGGTLRAFIGSSVATNDKVFLTVMYHGNTG